MSVAPPLRAAAILLWTTAIGFGVFCIPAIANLLAGRPVPIVMGFPAYGGGPFERNGMPTTIPMLIGFLLVCVLEGVAGWSLWGGHKFGALLAVGLIPVGAVFWWGFALPFPPIFALVRTALIVMTWRALR